MGVCRGEGQRTRRGRRATRVGERARVKKKEEKRREGDGRDLVSGKSGGEKLARLNQQQGRQL